ncbi:MAG TPA: YdcF family protein, partial [Polyangiaceae bacterium]
MCIAIVTLGCRVTLDGEGRLSGALGRRVRAAAHAYGAYQQQTGEGTLVVASGGRHWDGEVEADAMARELVRLGVPEAAIVRERCSLSTRENARYAAAALARRGIERALVVTCPWHLA